MYQQKDIFDLLRHGTDAWNTWRKATHAVPDCQRLNLQNAQLSGADLKDLDFTGTNFSNAVLEDADLRYTKLNNVIATNCRFIHAQLGGAKMMDSVFTNAQFQMAEMQKANLTNSKCERANFRAAFLREAILFNTTLSDADFTEAVLHDTNFSGTIAPNAILQRTILVNTDLSGADISGSRIFGASIWNIKVNEATQQRNLIITQDNEPEITVDHIEVAQLIYLLQSSHRVGTVLDVAASKLVLILGRFNPPEKKQILEAIADTLRQKNYVPLIFDFTPLKGRDMMTTISTLAHLSAFIIADISAPKSVPQEISWTIPHLTTTPMLPLICSSEQPYSMFETFLMAPHTLPIHFYNEGIDLVSSMPALVAKLEKRRAELSEKLQQARLILASK